MGNNTRPLEIELLPKPKDIKYVILNLAENKEVKKSYLLWQENPRQWLEIY